MYLFLMILFFFFFKQKTAYEMRISDWSSDVCSSDLVSTSKALGTSIERGGSCGARGKSWAGGPKKTCRMKRNEYVTLKALASTASAGKPYWKIGRAHV